MFMGRQKKFGLTCIVEEREPWLLILKIAESMPAEQYWMLLKKYGNISDVLGENTYKALFPIPDREIMMNYNLTQNPGYTR